VGSGKGLIGVLDGSSSSRSTLECCLFEGEGAEGAGEVSGEQSWSSGVTDGTLEQNENS